MSLPNISRKVGLEKEQGERKFFSTLHFLPLRDFKFWREKMLLTLREQEPKWSCHHVRRVNLSKQQRSATKADTLDRSVKELLRDIQNFVQGRSDCGQKISCLPKKFTSLDFGVSGTLCCFAEEGISHILLEQFQSMLTGSCQMKDLCYFCLIPQHSVRRPSLFCNSRLFRA